MMQKKTVNEFHALVTMAEFVAEAHDGQYRKGGFTPYSSHPMICALIAQKEGLPLRGVLAMMGHDVWEDCSPCWQLLLMETVFMLPLPFEDCQAIWNMIMALTKNDDLSPRAVRDADAIQRVVDAKESETAILKIIDRCHNLSRMGWTNDGFKKRYLEESKNLMKHVGDRVWGEEYDTSFFFTRGYGVYLLTIHQIEMLEKELQNAKGE